MLEIVKKHRSCSRHLQRVHCSCRDFNRRGL